MSQLVVNDEPSQAYAGQLQYGGAHPLVLSKLAGELIYFGKLVIVADADVNVGGVSGGPQQVNLPTSAAEVLLALNAGGVALADVSQPRMRDPLNPSVANSAPFGAYPDEAAVNVLRKGLVWVEVEAAVTALSDGVYVRVANVGTIPIAALGSFTPTDTADHEPAPAGMVWAGAGVGINGELLGLLSVTLP